MGALDVPIYRSLDQIRLDARSAQYGNSQEEADAIFAVEQRVYSAVALHEEHLIAQGEAHVTSGVPVFERTDALVHDLLVMRGEMDEPGVRVTADLAARYESLRKAAARELEALARIERSAEFQADKVADPYGSLDSLRKKYPSIAGVGLR
ncbi:hypothetical protein ACFT30_13600 [Microbacterium ureisolvens]|uniref:hypothetical protein n=1 Tax=Microbacterium ureisolvens TaxID=2781186 RepID=UPI0036443699